MLFSGVIICILSSFLYKIQSMKLEFALANQAKELDPQNKDQQKNSDTIVQDFFTELKYSGIKLDKKILQASNFARNYNVYFYTLINISVVLMVTFTNTALIAVSLMVTMHLCFMIFFAFTQWKHSFMISANEFVLRFLQEVFILVFVSVLMHMSIR